MKRLFYLIVIIGLPVIAYFQFENYRALHPPEDYTLAPNPEIDASYHDPQVVLSYYTLLQQAKSFAGSCWENDRLNVKTSDPIDPDHQALMARYHQYIATAQHLEQKLIQSAKWKKEGFSNAAIQKMETQDPMQRILEQWKGNSIEVATKGEKNELIFKVQEKLNTLGITMPIDGVFDTETETGITTFQNQKGLFPSGKIDMITFRTLFENQSVE
ncbi:MAG: peptidoglycan-binding protein [Bacteroidota bacterium]